MNPSVLVIGANGALGSDLMRVIPAAMGSTHADFDLRDKDAIAAFLQENRVDTVINTAAFHRVPDCETEYQQAFEVNIIGVRNLAELCTDAGIHLCHISTDYVFDGTARVPYRESDMPAPLSVYGISKLAGEHAALAYGEDVSIVRSCGLYGEVPTRAKGGNFINTMIRLGRSRDLVSVVDDEWVCPTYTYDLARAIHFLLKASGKGIFHISQGGQTTWYDFARVIFETLGLPARLEPTKAATFQSVVKRPAYSILDNRHFETLTGWSMPDWKDALLRHLDIYQKTGLADPATE